jgi:transcriptional regulator GlxA family with amidase domain
LKFEIIIYDGFHDLDVFGVLQPLAMAGLSVTLKSLREQEFVTTVSGVKVLADTFNLKDLPDLLIVPGGGWLARLAVGAWYEAERGDILDVLKAVHAKGKILASVCTGGLLLGRAGLLANRPATTNHAALDELKAMNARVLRARVVDDGDIITAGAVTASLDLGLWLVQRYCGPDKALEVSHALEFELRGPVWQGSIVNTK